MESDTLTGFESSVGAGLVSKLLSDGLRSLIIEVQRRNHVFRAIGGKVKEPTDSIVNKAYSDITQTLGRAGRVDSETDAFLRALGRSELVEPLAFAAFADVDWKPLQYPIFSIYVGAVKTERGPAAFEKCRRLTEDIFKGMRAHLTHPDVSTQLTLLTTLTSDIKKNAALRVRTAQKRWDLRDDKQEQILEPNVIAEKRPWMFIDPQALDGYVREFSKAVREAHEKITVAKPDRQRTQLPFKDVYVANDVEFNLGGNKDNQRTNILHEAFDFSHRFPKAVVLGNPGGGKSTLAQGYCLSLAAIGEANGDRFPILLRVRDMYATMRHGTGTSIIEFLIQHIAKLSEKYQPEELRAPIRNLLFHGRCVCIFDGLDEVIAVEDRGDLVNQVQRFISQWPRCSFFITSRPQGYSEAPLSQDFLQIRLFPFSDEEVGTYFQKISRTVFDVPERDISDQTDRFIAEVKRNAPDLSETPLLLSLIVWLFHSTSRIPDNRLEVYEQCAKLLFVEWDRARRIEAKVLEEHRLLQLLPFLAGEIYLDPDLTSSFDRKWLKRRVIEFFRGVIGETDGGRSEEAADQFVNHLSGRAWVLTEIATGEFEFTHRSFLEYFFAKHLDEEHESVGELIATLLPHLKGREWTLPAHIAVQLKADRGIKGAHRCAEALSEAIDHAPKHERANLVLFAAEACAYLQPPDRTIRKISSAVVGHAESESYWSTAFLSLVQVQSPLKEAVYSGVADGLVKLLSTHFAQNLSPTVDWLLALKLSNRGIISPVRIAWMNRSRDAYERIAEAVMERADLGQITLPVTYKALFDLTGQLAPQNREIYGHALWSSATRAGRRDWRIVDFLLMRNELIRVLGGRLELDSAPYAQLATLLLNNVDTANSEMVQSHPMVWADIKCESAKDLKIDDCDPSFLNALGYVNRGIKDLYDAFDPRGDVPDLDGPMREEAVFTVMGRNRDQLVSPRQILESYAR